LSVWYLLWPRPPFFSTPFYRRTLPSASFPFFSLPSFFSFPSSFFFSHPVFPFFLWLFLLVSICSSFGRALDSVFPPPVLSLPSLSAPAQTKTPLSPKTNCSLLDFVSSPAAPPSCSPRVPPVFVFPWPFSCPLRSPHVRTFRLIGPNFILCCPLLSPSFSLHSRSLRSPLSFSLAVFSMFLTFPQASLSFPSYFFPLSDSPCFSCSYFPPSSLPFLPSLLCAIRSPILTLAASSIQQHLLNIPYYDSLLLSLFFPPLSSHFTPPLLSFPLPRTFVSSPKPFPDSLPYPLLFFFVFPCLSITPVPGSPFLSRRS